MLLTKWQSVCYWQVFFSQVRYLRVQTKQTQVEHLTVNPRGKYKIGMKELVKDKHEFVTASIPKKKKFFNVDTKLQLF